MAFYMEMVLLKILVNDVNLYYEKIGRGHPLIMLHGNSQSLNIFHKMAAKLKDNFELYLVDSRNHGKSDESKEFSYYLMAEDLKEFIQRLNIKDPYVIGFSDGAICALLSEIKHPGTFSRMCLMGLNLSPDDLTDDAYEETKELYEFLQVDIIRIMLDSPHITEKELSEVNANILFIYGENDVFKEELYEKIKIAKNYKLLKVKDHDHSSYLKDNSEIIEDIKEFFGGKDADSTK